MTDREVMQMALYVLERVALHLMRKQDVEVMQALRAQLEQPERQTLQAAGTHPAPCARHCEAKAYEIEIRGLKSALRAALEQQQAEPVAYCYVKKGSSADALTFDQKPADAVSGTVFPLYTAPPQRKPLTWERISQIGLECANDKSRLPFEVKLARAIEQAHGIKETP